MNVEESPDTILTESTDGGEKTAQPVEESTLDVPVGSLVRFETVTMTVAAARLPEAAAQPAVPGETASFDAVSLIADSPTPDVALEALIVFERLPLPSKQTALGGAFWADDSDERESHPAFRRVIIREWAESLAMVLAFILVFTGYVAQATQVPTESMKPTILVGDHFFIEKLAFPGNYPAAVRPFLPQRAIHRGDIVVFRSPIDGKIPFVKRVIGTPGDLVEIREKVVFVNGVEIDEPYKIHTHQTVYKEDGFTPEGLKQRDNYGPQTVPPDSFFVMGDNRDNSNDSRYWGYVGREAIMGMPLFVYWSYRAVEPYVGPPPTIWERLNDYVSTARHFFSRTRWFRFGTLVQ